MNQNLPWLHPDRVEKLHAALAQRVLVLVWCRPFGQRGDYRILHRHRRTSSPSVDAGSRGAGSEPSAG